MPSGRPFPPTVPLRVGAYEVVERDLLRSGLRVRFVQVVPEPDVAALPDIPSLGAVEVMGSNKGRETITQGVPPMRISVAWLGTVGFWLQDAEGFFGSTPIGQLRMSEAFVPGGNVGAKGGLLQAVHDLIFAPPGYPRVFAQKRD